MKTIMIRRRSLLRALALGLFSLTASAFPADKLKVVATLPGLATLAREIGGEHVEVRGLTQGTENLHAVHVRPSTLIALSKADLFLEMGLSMEASWLPSLLIKARNPRINPKAAGFQNCSEGWQPIGVPATQTRKNGHIHPQGNPHFNLDPLGGPHLAKKVHEALVRVDPGNKATYDSNYEAWKKRLAAIQPRWKAFAEKLKGQKIAMYHQEFNYLAKRLGIEICAMVEPKPGIPPTAADVSRVVKLMKSQDVHVIVTAAWSNNRLVAEIAKKSGAVVLELPNQVGGASWAKDWISLIDGMQTRLAQAFGIKDL